MDEYDGIFDHLTPEDFIDKAVTTAFQETDYPDTQYPDGQTGSDAFGLFVEEGLRALRYSFTAANGNLMPIGVLANTTMRRSFDATDEETISQFVDRLHQEAKLMGAHWFFFSILTVGTIRPLGTEEDNSAPVNHVIPPVDSTPAVYWYARNIEGDGELRHGLIGAEADRLVPEGVEAPSTQTNDLLEAVLLP